MTDTATQTGWMRWFVDRLVVNGWKALPCGACQRDGDMGVHHLHEGITYLLASQDALTKRAEMAESLGAAMKDWQPIATAPRPTTGRRRVVDLWCVTDDHESAQFYFGATMSGVKGKMMWQGRVSEVYWCEGAWRPVGGLVRHPLTVTPIAWKPLPAPPPETEA